MGLVFVVVERPTWSYPKGRRASRLSRGGGFFVVCVGKKNQVEGLKIILLPAIKSKFMAIDVFENYNIDE